MCLWQLYQVYKPHRISQYSIMKAINPVKTGPKKKKNGVNSTDALPAFIKMSKTVNQSQRQSPYISFRKPGRESLAHPRYDSVDEIRRSGGEAGQSRSNLKEKSREQSREKQRSTNKQKQNRSLGMKPAGKQYHPQFMSCTQSPMIHQTQANEDACWGMGVGMRRTDFKFMYQIGFGGFGKVWKVQKRASWHYYAMKEIQKRKVIEKDSVECIMNERKVLTKIRHPFIVNIKYAFQDKECLYLIMDYLKGADLRYHICYKEHFSQTETKFILACLMLAVEEIHAKGIIHRDIKPENLVLEESGYVRLTDFGIAKYIKQLKQKGNKFDTSGTPGYMAPQVMMKEGYDQVSDYFGMGVIGYELMLGKRPYLGKNRKEIKESLMEKQVQIEEDQLPLGWSAECRDFINRLIMKNPKQRLGSQGGIRQLKQHRWMSDINWKKLHRKQMVPPFIPNIVCETKSYLEEIQSYNEMNDEKVEQGEQAKLTPEEDRLFVGYQCMGDSGVGSCQGSPYVTPLKNIRNTIDKDRSREKNRNFGERLQKMAYRQKKVIKMH